MAAVYEPFDWYETPLYYDMVFDLETGVECDFLEALYASHVTAGQRRVLEPACGSGRLVAALAARGYRVTGFDISEGGLAFARRRMREVGLRAHLVRARMESFLAPDARSGGRLAPGSFDMAHCLVSSFRYLLDEEQARAHLQQVAEALAPGGIYVLGFHLTEYDDAGVLRERMVAERAGTRVVCNIQTEPADQRTRRQRLRSRLVVETAAGTGRSIRRFETRWVLRTYSVRQFRALLAQVPALAHVATYDFDYDLARPQALGAERLDQVVILQKRPG